MVAYVLWARDSLLASPKASAMCHLWPGTISPRTAVRATFGPGGIHHRRSMVTRTVKGLLEAAQRDLLGVMSREVDAVRTIGMSAHDSALFRRLSPDGWSAGALDR